jgi:NAD-dependent dihydropyrimidine dehydrogenase PreA subunit
MIKSIDKLACTNCGLCEKICPMDVFLTEEGNVNIVYQSDCCNCAQCMYICPVDAIAVTAGEPKKYRMNNEWFVIKEMMGVK